MRVSIDDSGLEFVTCNKCEVIQPSSRFRRTKGYWYKICLDCRNAAQRIRCAALRIEALLHYGGTCACCGEAEMGFLSIDHIDGGGQRHRNTVKRHGGAFYQWLRREGWPEGFQVLCYNCNLARQNVGRCPHEVA